MTDFQRSVNLYNPLAVEGDFASVNPRAAVLTSAGGLVTGPLGVTVARFAWVAADGRTVTNFGEGAVAPTGYVRRDMGAALITQYLGEFGNLIPGGFPITLFDAGDFWIKVRGNAAVYGSSVYAAYADGTPYVGAAPAGATATGSIGATFTATATGTSLAVTSVTGIISPGDTISGTGVPTGTTIVSGPSAGGAGTYITSGATTAASATVTSFGNVVNVTAVATGTLAPGQAVTGTGVPASATFASQLSGAVGGIGVYTLNIPASAYAASTALTVAGGIVTKFVVKTAGAVGDLVKISTWGN